MWWGRMPFLFSEHIILTLRTPPRTIARGLFQNSASLTFPPSHAPVSGHGHSLPPSTPSTMVNPRLPDQTRPNLLPHCAQTMDDSCTIRKQPHYLRSAARSVLRWESCVTFLMVWYDLCILYVRGVKIILVLEPVFAQCIRGGKWDGTWKDHHASKSLALKCIAILRHRTVKWYCIIIVFLNQSL